MAHNHDDSLLQLKRDLKKVNLIKILIMIAHYLC